MLNAARFESATLVNFFQRLPRYCVMSGGIQTALCIVTRTKK